MSTWDYHWLSLSRCRRNTNLCSSLLFKNTDKSHFIKFRRIHKLLLKYVVNILVKWVWIIISFGCIHQKTMIKWPFFQPKSNTLAKQLNRYTFMSVWGEKQPLTPLNHWIWLSWTWRETQKRAWWKTGPEVSSCGISKHPEVQTYLSCSFLSHNINRESLCYFSSP